MTKTIYIAFLILIVHVYSCSSVSDNGKIHYEIRHDDNLAKTIPLIDSIRFDAFDSKNNGLDILLRYKFDMLDSNKLDSIYRSKILHFASDIVNTHSYRDVYFTHREKIERQIEDSLMNYFKNAPFKFGYVELYNVNLPDSLLEIENK